MGTVTLTQVQFDELGEYSCSIPTGTTIGKRWKCDVHAHPAHKGKPPLWHLGEYYDLGPPDNEKNVGIRWSKIVVLPMCKRHPEAKARTGSWAGVEKWYCPVCGNIVTVNLGR